MAGLTIAQTEHTMALLQFAFAEFNVTPVKFEKDTLYVIIPKSQQVKPTNKVWMASDVVKKLREITNIHGNTGMIIKYKEADPK